MPINDLNKGSVLFSTDGTRTWAQEMQRLFNAIDTTKFNERSFLHFANQTLHLAGYNAPYNSYTFTSTTIGDTVSIIEFRFGAVNARINATIASNVIITDVSSNIAPSGLRIELFY